MFHLISRRATSPNCPSSFSPLQSNSVLLVINTGLPASSASFGMILLTQWSKPLGSPWFTLARESGCAEFALLSLQQYPTSYTSTLATLIRARQRVSQNVSPQNFVGICQGNPDRRKAPDCVVPGLAIVAQHIPSFTSLLESHATVQGAFKALSRNQWLDLACHRMPIRQQPLSLPLRYTMDLSCKDTIRSHWQNPEVAFWSACHTTRRR
ncbi:hypothetical protein DEU56DRAFT_786263 [Suillus clintonianus]|uniref:uncharacterized protein n=1 Tax=Suillus clintonianus TaxID=1904413 RepID=UPI001B87A305|nr:uncharacterized protein DEU56DRAFT_786263 [Suillus clintonianus]KAG2146761.1 hypothetical protein DEU56DRAFT_786263 [Suillus clintonianus]